MSSTIFSRCPKVPELDLQQAAFRVQFLWLSYLKRSCILQKVPAALKVHGSLFYFQGACEEKQSGGGFMQHSADWEAF